MKFDPSIFKDYDIRGEYPSQVNPSIFKAIAKQMALDFKPHAVSLGRDNRFSSRELCQAMIGGFTQMGVNVIDLGMISTDMIYFAAGKYDYDLNIVITGSHAEGENGLKACLKGAVALSGDSGLYQIQDKLLGRTSFPEAKKQGSVSQKNIVNAWIDHAFSFVDLKKIKPFKIVFDTGNGVGGPILVKVEEKLPGKFINLFFPPDANFPHHFPNPLIEANLKDIQQTIKTQKADFGVAFDADADRAFFLDEKGRVISGTVLTAMIAKSILQRQAGEIILYNAVCGRIVPETIEKYGGKAMRVRVGHTLIKQKMREHNAVFAGEHSGHFYFRDNFYADSGLIATLKTIELISGENRPLSQIVADFQKYPQSGEINFEVADKEKMMKAIEAIYQNQAKAVDWLDGLSVWFADWWFNLRPSHTEPLLRLNVEADNKALLKQKIQILQDQLISRGAKLH